jgi:selenide, water dikinase
MRLTELAKSAGCAGKLGPGALDLALKLIPKQNIPGVLVGYENSDDAGVFQLTPDTALVQTVDYFPPIVDDPYTYGQIAAVNALSDVYAMGGQPRTALSVVGFPATGTDFKILGQIMSGGLDKLNEAGVALLGGHSVRDDEIKFGYAITGVVETRNIKQNKGARAGNRVLLTKPLGTGLITTAIKRGRAAAEDIQAAVAAMLQLNRRASEICLEFHVDAMTDVTGFGLAGHASEVAKASHISIHIDHRKVPLLPGVLEYSRLGFCAGGLTSNEEFFGPQVSVAESISREMRNVLFDPQTSGGLLVFCQAQDAKSLLDKLRSESIDASDIGFTAAEMDRLLTLT